MEQNSSDLNHLKTIQKARYVPTRHSGATKRLLRANALDEFLRLRLKFNRLTSPLMAD